jgi:protease-4
MSVAQARGLADGRVFTGRQALSVNLIDEIGGPPAARSWLEAERGVSRELPGRDLGSEEVEKTILRRIIGLAEKTLLSERLMLDGLISVWHLGGLR